VHPIVVFLLDGLADRAHELLGGRSGLEAARTPNFDRLASQGIIASMQPYHAIDDGRWAEYRIGAKRCACPSSPR